MEAEEEEWNKELSAHKLLDKKVLCKQNGGIGKTSVSMSCLLQTVSDGYFPFKL